MTTKKCCRFRPYVYGPTNIAYMQVHDMLRPGCWMASQKALAGSSAMQPSFLSKVTGAFDVSMLKPETIEVGNCSELKCPLEVFRKLKSRVDS